MEYMESKMQDFIEGGIELQNAICDDACDIYKETGIMPLDMKMQRDELLHALIDATAALSGVEEDRFNIDMDAISLAINGAKNSISRATGEQA